MSWRSDSISSADWRPMRTRDFDDEASSDSTVRLEVADSPMDYVHQSAWTDCEDTSTWDRAAVGSRWAPCVVRRQIHDHGDRLIQVPGEHGRRLTDGRGTACDDSGISSNVNRHRRRPSSASSSTSSAGSTLSVLRRKRAEFHGAGRFTRYRYPVKFHHAITNATPEVKTSSQAVVGFLPASLRTTTRYGQEPTIQSSGQRRRVVTDNKRSTRVKRTRVMVDTACQCSLRAAVMDASCQAGSGATSHVNRAASTGHQTYQDAAVMTIPVHMVSRMTETDVRLVELPEIDFLTSRLTLSGDGKLDELNNSS